MLRDEFTAHQPVLQQLLNLADSLCSSPELDASDKRQINDKVTADYTEDPEALAKEKGMEPGRRVGEGTFALQAHDPGSTVLYRNIKVKRLP